MKILVTGADGFVGSRLVPRLLEDGHEVVAAVRAEPDPRARQLPEQVQRLQLELRDTHSVNGILRDDWDAVVHLAAMASGGEAGRDPVGAWEINTLGTVRLAHALGDRVRSGEDPLLLVVSTAEVYGGGPAVPRGETDPPAPCSPYAASKLAAEIAALEVHCRTGLRVVIARPFPHTGPGQDDRFVVPAFAGRIRVAKRIGAPAIKVGSLDSVREFMHVADVVEAYARLITAGRPGEVYNVASGEGISVAELYRRLTAIIDYAPVPETDPKLVRPLDVPHLVGDSRKLRALTGWAPTIGLEETLREVVHAQAN